jgi:hypothetical protein
VIRGDFHAHLLGALLPTLLHLVNEAGDLLGITAGEPSETSVAGNTRNFLESYSLRGTTFAFVRREQNGAPVRPVT